ncbi:mannose-1-phosphate guanylyltransferase [Nostoc sp.]|uniref:mannose-1-phosphate guanylyltransferase n=1 Tax=Nostoc sp. TaxID=1180 RepID=UPI002FFBC370
MYIFQEIDVPSIKLEKVVVLITAGGQGLRLWPLSTLEKPKQFCCLLSEKTMLQITLDRVKNLVPLERIFIVTCADQVKFVKQQIPKLQAENIIVEPESRDNAPAIGYAAVYIERKISDATMVVLASDQYISPIEQFESSLLKAIEVAQNGNYFVSVGIKPTAPSTEYGYMKCGRQMQFGATVYAGIQYIEKPDLDTAESFLNAKNYIWNTNIFVWQISHLLDAFKIYQLESYKVLKKIQTHLEYITPQELSVFYRQLDKISIDFAILEKIKVGDFYSHAFVIGEFEWSDVGNYSELAKQLEVNKFGDRCKGLIHKEHTENCLLIAETPYKLHVKGISNLTVVINAQGDILVSLTSSVKKLKNLLQVTNMNHFSSENKNPNGDTLPRTAKIINSRNIIFDSDHQNMICALDVENLSVKIRHENVYVYGKQ